MIWLNLVQHFLFSGTFASKLLLHFLFRYQSWQPFIYDCHTHFERYISWYFLCMTLLHFILFFLLFSFIISGAFTSEILLYFLFCHQSWQPFVYNNNTNITRLARSHKCTWSIMHCVLVNDFIMFTNVSDILYSHQRNAIWSPKPKRTVNPTEIQNLCASLCIHSWKEGNLSLDMYRMPKVVLHSQATQFCVIENECHFSYQPNH